MYTLLSVTGPYIDCVAMRCSPSGVVLYTSLETSMLILESVYPKNPNIQTISCTYVFIQFLRLFNPLVDVNFDSQAYGAVDGERSRTGDL